VPLFLADTSIWSWAEKLARPDIAEKLARRLERREIATCVPVALEVMHRAETGELFETRFSLLLEPLDWIPLDDAAGRRALEVQRELAPRSHGNHRRPAIDFLIAAAAEAAGDDVALWFLDRDLRVICEHTGQPYEAEEAA
jgi:predicted nucleic acid-binding protein